MRILPICPALFLLPAGFIVLPSAAASAVVVPSTCPPYEIEGSIEPAPTDLDVTAQATVYLHTGSEPLPDHQVFATFTTESGEPVGEPVVLVTNAEGRAAVAVPDGATSVSFVAEGPENPECVSGGEPSVALEISAGGGAISGDSIPGGLSDLVPDEGLAHTGPVTAGVVATAVLVGAVGCGVWMGRGRKVRGVESMQTG